MITPRSVVGNHHVLMRDEIGSVPFSFNINGGERGVEAVKIDQAQSGGSGDDGRGLVALRWGQANAGLRIIR